MINYKNLGITS